MRLGSKPVGVVDLVNLPDLLRSTWIVDAFISAFTCTTATSVAHLEAHACLKRIRQHVQNRDEKTILLWALFVRSSFRVAPIPD